MKYKGSCLCGEIQYEVSELQSKMAHCHCSMCRKFHGAAFATFGEANSKHFKWVKGRRYLQAFIAKNGTTRKFCRLCGSSLAFASAGDDGTVIEFSLSTLDTPISRKPDAHIFVENKANWYDITDHLPKFSSARTQD